MSEILPIPDPADSSEIRRLVEDYCSTQRHPSLAKFIVHNTISINNLWKSNVFNGFGCYIFYREDGSVKYIGMSGQISNRLASQLSRATQASPFWIQGPAYYVDIIEVTQPWEAPSLEVYLTQKIASLRSRPDIRSDIDMRPTR